MAKVEKTQKQWFEEAITMAENAGNQEMVEFFEGRIAALSKKAEKAKEVKQEDVQLCEKILRTLGEGLMTVSEIKAAGGFDESAPKITAMLTKMVKEGKVSNTKDKKKSYYSVA